MKLRTRQANLLKRLESLERGLRRGEVLTLRMPDGTYKAIPLRGRHGTLDLFQRCFDDPHCPEAELIRASVQQIDSNSGHMGEVIWGFLNSPVESNEEEDPQPDMTGP
jgi:hypothetical protein